jgi:hypothetical protein
LAGPGFLEIAALPVHLDHVASLIVNADHKRSGLLTRMATESVSSSAPMKC